MRSLAAWVVVAVLGLAAAARADLPQEEEPQTPPSSSAQAPDVHLAIGGGAGVAFGFAGAHVEVRGGHLAGFLGVGADLLSLTPAPAVAVGARYLSGNGAGLLLSLNFATSSDYRADPYSRFSHEFEQLDHRYLSATLGWRLRHHTGFFGELGAGALLLWELDRGRLNFGATGKWTRTAFVDLDFALGFEF